LFARSILSVSIATSTGGWNEVRLSACSGAEGMAIFSAACSGLSVGDEKSCHCCL
jgi:hypothetical protein